MQGLLEERFGLVAHPATREEHGYAMVVAKGGPRLTKGVGDGGLAYILRDGIRGKGLSMQSLTGMVALAAKEPVEDQTGLADSTT